MPKRRRRSFTPQFKAQVVLEVLLGQRNASEAARQHMLHDQVSRFASHRQVLVVPSGD
jgi:transposase-like protein